MSAGLNMGPDTDSTLPWPPLDVMCSSLPPQRPRGSDRRVGHVLHSKHSTCHWECPGRAQVQFQFTGHARALCDALRNQRQAPSFLVQNVLRRWARMFDFECVCAADLNTRRNKVCAPVTTRTKRNRPSSSSVSASSAGARSRPRRKEGVSNVWSSPSNGSSLLPPAPDPPFAPRGALLPAIA
eukprot:3099923-Rhodomonas_salina.1